MEKSMNSIQRDRGNPGILTSGQAGELLAEGWQAADLHVHTLHSYDVIPTRGVDPLQLYTRARRLGMTYVAFTDHDTMAAYDEIGWTREGLVPAVEVKILDRVNVGHTVHINVYTLDRGQFAEIRRIVRVSGDIRTLAGFLTDEGLPFVFNHPFWHEPGEVPNLRAVLEIAGLFPVLEYNMGRVGRINAQALKLAHSLSKGIVASTDSHIGDIGRAFTLARGDGFKSFFAEIAAGRAFIHPADLTLRRLKEETYIRVRSLFDKAGWLFDKETLAMETGSAVLDGIVTRLAREDKQGPAVTRWILRKALEILSGSGIPGSLYLRSQNGLADRISDLMGSMGSAA
jgi:predicted metal-dependent phosphoesterase TrpH